MGESLVERPTAEKKMDESFESSAGLEVSVSFGRFENDVLSWEKWSSFSPNRYLEEVGNLSTPGSVAQKKAYFEAHYRRIAAKKAEELEQEKSMMPATCNLNESSNGNCVGNSCGIDADFGLSNGQRSVETADKADAACVNEAKCDDSDSSEDDDFDSRKDDNNDIDIGVERERSLVEEAKDELNGNVVDVESNGRVEAASCEVVESPKGDTLQTKEKPPGRKNGAKQSTPKSNARIVPQKVISTERATNSPAIKSLSSSTPKNSKKASVSTPRAASQPLMKRDNGSSVTKSKRAVSTSLHMSLSLGPVSSSPAQSMSRKSLMMEKMGDKDIIRRAFKTFQNRVYGSCSDNKSNTPKQVRSTASEVKISTPQPRRKGKEGVKSDTEKMSARRNQSRTRSINLDSGSCRSSVVWIRETPRLSHRPLASEAMNELKRGKSFCRIWRRNPLREQQKMLNVVQNRRKKRSLR